MGFSACTATPFLPGTGSYPQGTRRVNVGGKALTNLLKERASLRELDLSTDFIMAERILRLASFVSPDFGRDVKMLRFLDGE